MVDQIYTRATGWLGWTDEATMNTPLAQLYMAFEGHVDFLRKTNPFRTKEDIEDDRIREQKPDPESGVRLFQALKAMAKPLPKREPKEATDG